VIDMQQGINNETGENMTGLAHLQQSIKDILTTPIGSRVRRRDYGSKLPDLIDHPINDGNIIEVYAATALALRKWEPRITVQRVQAYLTDEVGQMLLVVTGKGKTQKSCERDGNAQNTVGIKN
jgi:hypothetical protein